MNDDRTKMSRRRAKTLKKLGEDRRHETPTMQWAHLKKVPKPVPGSLFPIGRVVATVGAVEYMKRNGVGMAELLYLQQTGDWGEMNAADQAENAEAVASGSRILSCYRRGLLQEAIWIITRADRTETMLLLPAEFAALP